MLGSIGSGFWGTRGGSALCEVGVVLLLEVAGDLSSFAASEHRPLAVMVLL